MTLIQQIYSQANLLAGKLDARQEAMLKILCQAAHNYLAVRLRTGLTPNDCKAEFIAAASLYALSCLSRTDDANAVAQFTAGDLSIRPKNGDAAANCLRNQADVIITPYLQDDFSFQGV